MKTFQAIQIINLIFLSFITTSCGPKDKAEIYKEGKCDIYLIKDSGEMWIKNTSKSEVITFTVEETIIETNVKSTRILEIAPGDYDYLGCEQDLQGHKSYKVVGAYYGKKN